MVNYIHLFSDNCIFSETRQYIVCLIFIYIYIAIDNYIFKCEYYYTSVKTPMCYLQITIVLKMISLILPCLIWSFQNIKLNNNNNIVIIKKYTEIIITKILSTVWTQYGL